MILEKRGNQIQKANKKKRFSHSLICRFLNYFYQMFLIIDNLITMYGVMGSVFIGKSTQLSHISYIENKVLACYGITNKF